MNVLYMNPNVSLPNQLTSAYSQYREMSSSTNSKMTYSSYSTKSSNKTKNSNRISVFIALCVHPDENYICRTICNSPSSRYRNLAKLHDEFGCNVLMYCLRYQRYRLFDFLLNATNLDFNLREADQQGNTILHYAVLYGGNTTQIMDKLIEKYKKFSIAIDDRNQYGHTALLLAVFCGRYDLVLSLLTKTDSSPFARDYIQFKNMFDYIESDIKNRESINQSQYNRKNPLLNRESTRLRIELHHTIPSRQETSFYMIQHHPKKNFFEIVLPQVTQDQSDLLRSSILDLQKSEHLSATLINLINYLNQRYPNIKNLQLLENSKNNTEKTKISLKQEDSKTNVHNILNLFDPNIRPKVVSLKSSTTNLFLSTKPPITFKRVGTKITTLATFSRIPVDKKDPSFVFFNCNK